MTEQELRRLYAALQNDRRSGAGAPTVPLENVLAAVEGRGSEEERIATIEAALAHPVSAREMEMLRALAANRRSVPAFQWRTATLILAAAAVVAVVAVPVTRDLLRSDTSGIVRDGAGEAVLLGPPEQATVENSRTFRWHGVSGARVYALEILTSSGTLVFTTRTADTTVTLPSDVRLAPGVEHQWWITAEMSDGTQRPSAFRRLLVRAPR